MHPPLSLLAGKGGWGDRGNLLLLLVLLIAFAVRVHDLGAQSLWNDEGNSLRLAQRSPADLVDAAGRDIHPPGYYLALKAWIALAGESEFGLRALSALMGVITVAATIALGRALFSRAPALIAGLIVALSPFAVYYSQETRMYAALALFSALSMLAFTMWIRRGVLQYAPTRYSSALALALINTAGLYTQYSFPFTLIAQGVLFLVLLVWLKQQNRPVRRPLLEYLLVNLITLVLFLPWLPTAWDQITTWPRTGVNLALDEQLRTVAGWLTYGSTAGDVAWLRLIFPALLIVAALRPAAERGRSLPLGWRIALPVIWAGVVIGALFASGAYREANLKFLLPAQIALALLIGRGVWVLWNLSPVTRAPDRVPDVPDRPRRRLLRYAPRRDRLFKAGAVGRMLAAVCLFLLVIGQLNALDALYHDLAYARDDYRAAAAFIMRDQRPGDAIILDAPNQAEVFSYYYHGDSPVYSLPRGLGGDDARTRAEVEAVLRDHRRVYVLFWGETERDPNRVVQATLDAGAYPVGSSWYGDVRLAQYAVLGDAPTTPQVTVEARFGESITLTGYALSAAEVRPGDVLGVTLFWTTDSPLLARYKVTVQLLTPDGRLVAQHDAEPGGDRALTTTWTPGAVVMDTHGLVIPPDLSPGDYSLLIGLYDLNPPQDRLPVMVDGEPVGDAFSWPVRLD